MGPTQRTPLARLGQRDRLLVGVAELAPALRGALPLAGALQQVGIRIRPFGQRDLDAGELAPIGDGGAVRVTRTQRESEGRLQLSGDCLRAALEPPGLGARHGHRPDPLQLVTRLCGCARLVQQHPRVGVTPPRAYEPQRDQRMDARERGSSSSGRSRRERQPHPNAQPPAPALPATRPGSNATRRSRGRRSSSAPSAGARRATSHQRSRPAVRAITTSAPTACEWSPACSASSTVRSSFSNPSRRPVNISTQPAVSVAMTVTSG